MINWFNMPTEGLSNGGQFEIKELTATENKTYEKDGEVYNKVTVNVSGGGSSDFSTAKVSVINQTELPVSFETALLIDEDDEKFFTVSTTVFGGQTKETEVVLYNGVSVDPTLINSNEVPVSIAVTGDIEIVENLSITGDGTITITDPQS